MYKVVVSNAYAMYALRTAIEREIKDLQRDPTKWSPAIYHLSNVLFEVKKELDSIHVKENQ